MFHWLIWFVLVLCTLSSSPANKTIDDLQAGISHFTQEPSFSKQSKTLRHTSSCGSSRKHSKRLLS